MISRFIVGLTSPKRIIQCKDDRWYYPIAVLLLMVLLTMIPVLYYSVNTEILTYDVQKEIRTSFVHSDIVNYKIEKKKLVYLGEGDNITKVSTKHGTFIFTNGGIPTESFDMTLNYVFLREYVLVTYGNIDIDYFEYGLLRNLEGIDFRLAKVDDYDFWTRAFTDVNKILSSMEDYFIFGNVTANVLIVIGDVLLCTILLSLLLKFQTGEKYRCAFKMALYSCIPMFIGVFFSLIYNVRFLSTIGMIWSFIYAHRVSYLLRIKRGI